LSRAEILVAVPNISEGRRPELVEQIAGEQCLLDVHIDPDHNRSVLTYGGPPGEVVEACIAMARRAIAHLVLSEHEGVHPRSGVVDVMPFVDHLCSEATALDAARSFAAAMTVPVHHYERADPERRPLPALRLELQRERGDAICVGVRGPLIAFNVNLHAPLEAARGMARDVRRHLHGLRALAFELPSRRLVQVSMNLVDPKTTGPRAAFDRVAELSRAGGYEIVDAEIVGLVPQYSMGELADMPLRVPARSVEEALR
jgi:glutamate formiminotransferase